MVVTKIEYQKKDPNRVNLYVDNLFFLGISLDTLASENLYEGLEISEKVLGRIVKKDLEDRFLTRVMNYLSRSPKTELQVYRYLRNLRYKKKNVWFKDDLDIEWENLFNSIVNRLKEYKYINDEEYARSSVSSRIRNKPRGKSILIQELLSKGVDRELAQRVCNELIESEYEILRRSFEKRFRNQKFSIDNQQMVNYLLRKGYSWDLIVQFSKDDTTE